ncbi:hypothetical protein DCC81_04360 [Chitinophaga parva]|uniref:Uncharacterized protein n=1 Tax=Chitinophaga parva TaxID=2169414 RepID=A0A2T7BM14_9BACT|nr:hypothetical protein DCC81_04360 [Chitinophaga parva]
MITFFKKNLETIFLHVYLSTNSIDYWNYLTQIALVNKKTAVGLRPHWKGACAKNSQAAGVGARY